MGLLLLMIGAMFTVATELKSGIAFKPPSGFANTILGETFVNHLNVINDAQENYKVYAVKTTDADKPPADKHLYFLPTDHFAPEKTEYYIGGDAVLWNIKEKTSEFPKMKIYNDKQSESESPRPGVGAVSVGMLFLKPPHIAVTATNSNADTEDSGPAKPDEKKEAAKSGGNKEGVYMMSSYAVHPNFLDACFGSKTESNGPRTFKGNLRDTLLLLNPEWDMAKFMTEWNTIWNVKDDDKAKPEHDDQTIVDESDTNPEQEKKISININTDGDYFLPTMITQTMYRGWFNAKNEFTSEPEISSPSDDQNPVQSEDSTDKKTRGIVFWKYNTDQDTKNASSSTKPDADLANVEKKDEVKDPVKNFCKNSDTYSEALYSGLFRNGKRVDGHIIYKENKKEDSKTIPYTYLKEDGKNVSIVEIKEKTDEEVPQKEETGTGDKDVVAGNKTVTDDVVPEANKTETVTDAKDVVAEKNETVTDDVVPEANETEIAPPETVTDAKDVAEGNDTEIVTTNKEQQE